MISFFGIHYAYRFWCTPLAVVKMQTSENKYKILNFTEVYIFGIRIVYFTRD